MKKRNLHLLTALALALCLLCTSCGNDAETPPQDDPNEGMGDYFGSLQDDPNEGLGDNFSEDADSDLSMYEGIWLGDADNEYDSMEIDADGNWQLYLSGDVVDEGYLRYEPEWEAVYAYSSLDDSGSRISLENGNRLYTTSYGYFNFGDGMEYLWYEDGHGDLVGDGRESGRLTEDDEPYPPEDDVPDWNGRLDGNDDQYYSWDATLYQRNVSEFEGVWYYDGDLSAETYIMIDGSGNWSYYQRAPGTEAAEMDCGILSYSTDEASTYYADSTMYDGVSIRVYEFDADVIIWGDEGAYYLME